MCNKCNCEHNHLKNNSCGCDCHSYGHLPEEGSKCRTVGISADQMMERISHSDNITINRGSPFASVIDHFAIPAVGDQGVIKVQGEILKPPSGAQVYVSVDGYIARLHISSVTRFYGDAEHDSPCNQGKCGEPKRIIPDDIYTEITVVNQGLACNNLTPGSYIGMGETIGFVFPDCNDGLGGGLGDTFLCDKYHAPAVGGKTIIEVSPNASNYTPLDIIQFGGYTLTVTAVTATTLEVRNDGLGGAEGSVLDGCDCASVKLFKVSGQDPCEVQVDCADGVTVCDNGVQKTLKPSSNQEGAVYFKDGRVCVQELDLPKRILSEFTGCITLDPDKEACSTYPIQVPDGTIFSLYQTVRFTCDDLNRDFVITSINGNVINVQPVDEVLEVATVGDGCANCKLEVVADCSCMFNYAPDFVTDSIVSCHQGRDADEWTPIEVSLPDGTRSGFFEYENPVPIKYTNNKPFPVTVCIDTFLNEFTNNIRDELGTTNAGRFVHSRYAWALVDCETNLAIASTGFSLEPSDNNQLHPVGTATFPNSGGWHDGDTDFFNTGSGSMCACKELACGETWEVKLVEKFAYTREADTEPMDITDFMCSVFDWKLEAKFVNTLPNEV